MDIGYEERYQTGDTPWDHGMPDFNLTQLVEHRPIAACKALDIGCGTGDNSIWLAQQGFVITGCDLSETAIARAKEKSSLASVDCKFRVADFLVDSINGAPFGFVFDRGCLHCITDEGDRRRFAKNVAAHLREDGLWLSLVGNADEPEREVGPPQLSASELVSIIEPYFEILSLQTGHFGSDQKDPPQAWVFLVRKRG
jgi:SAM-dependent methyltransferase